MSRAWNFYAGPATLPTSVLETARDEMLDWQGTGTSVMETSHRSKEYDHVLGIGLVDGTRIVFDVLCKNSVLLVLVVEHLEFHFLQRLVEALGDPAISACKRQSEIVPRRKVDS